MAAVIREDDSMGMEVTNGSNPYKTKQELRDYQGNAVARATITSAKVQQKKAAKKKKLNYNYRRISRQITMSNTTGGIRRVITRARDQVVDLLRKQISGKYDETDVRHAIIHARKMERVARKKKKHLEQEEKAKATGKALIEKGEDSSSKEEKELEKAANGLSKEELERLIAEYEELMQEMEQTNGMDEVMKEYMGATEVEMSPEQLDQLRKKHRSDEMKDIVEADMKYLKALFNKLAREKQETSNGNPAVSLELEGVDIPVPQETAEASAAEMVEGANVDVTV
jgi:hypothetical protein